VDEGGVGDLDSALGTFQDGGDGLGEVNRHHNPAKISTQRRSRPFAMTSAGQPVYLIAPEKP
jgi:hypothetical protein